MILSVSRRCDIPAFFGEWFMNRLKEGFVCVRNPYRHSSVSKIILSPQTIDCIVFWTKNPSGILEYLPQISNMGYRYYFQFTLTPYDGMIEKGVADKEKLIQTFQRLSNMIGKQGVVWRYDPILLTSQITTAWHIEKFEVMCKRLSGYADTVVISFLDEYKKLDRKKYRAPDLQEMLSLGTAFAKTAKGYGLRIQTCAEEVSLAGIEKGACIDKERIGKICGYPISASKDKNQRNECLCAESVDIGEYDTCAHFCEYCYANNYATVIKKKLSMHDPYSPFLIGNAESDDEIRVRMGNSLRSLF